MGGGGYYIKWIKKYDSLKELEQVSEFSRIFLTVSK